MPSTHGKSFSNFGTRTIGVKCPMINEKKTYFFILYSKVNMGNQFQYRKKEKALDFLECII